MSFVESFRLEGVNRCESAIASIAVRAGGAASDEALASSDMVARKINHEIEFAELTTNGYA